MAGIWDWSSTASSNTAIDGINVNTGMSPANVDNVFRSIAALVRSSFATALQNFLAGTAPLPVANGGTGGTDSATGLAGLGALSSDYRDIPYRSLSTGPTFADTDRANGVEFTGGTAATLTINPHATTPIGSAGKVAVIVVFNNSTASLTTAIGTGVTLKKNGGTSSANVTLAPGSVTAFYKFGTSDNWLAVGANIA